MRRLTAGLVIPILAILMAALFPPQSPSTATADPEPAALESKIDAVTHTVESVTASLRCFLSGASAAVTVAGDLRLPR